MTSSVRSILEKPLTQLTEDDISQLTREDCRKFLKDKGMRRPSWNKSQAIQQVISLKALLEGSEDDSGARTLRRIAQNPPPRDNSNSGDSGKEPSSTANVSEDLPPFQRRDAPESAPQGDAASSPVKPPDTKAASPRSVEVSEDAVVGQMTIFYCGQVNVYDRVAPDKAKSIMQLAASSTVHMPQDDSVNGSPPVWSFPCRVHASNGPSSPRLTNSSINQTEKVAEFPQQRPGKGNCPRELDAEGQLNRKALLQKYLEKRKDRGRFKNRKDGGSAAASASSNMEIYLNHQARPTPVSSTEHMRKSTSSRRSPPQPSETMHEPKMVCLSVDLNEEGI